MNPSYYSTPSGAIYDSKSGSLIQGAYDVNKGVLPSTRNSSGQYLLGVSNGQLQYGNLPTGSSSSYPNYVPPSSSPYAVDSSSVVSGEQSTLNSLKSLLAQAPDYQNLMNTYNNSVDVITNYRNDLAARRQAQIDSINQQYNQEKNATEAAQTRETGATTVALTRVGGYLGNSGSGVGVLNNLAVTHRAELAKLSTQRDAAIQAAQTAVDDKDFAAAQMQVNLAKDIQNTIYQRQQDFFGNVIQLNKAEQDASDSQRSQAKDLLSAWSKLTDTTGISTKQKSFVDSLYGAGFSDKYLAASKISAAAEAQKDNVAAMKAYVDLIQSVPAGVSIPIGNDTITGIGKTSDLETFQVTDDYGNVSVVNYNKGNGKYSVASLGRIGKGKEGGASGTLSLYQNKFQPDQITTLPSGKQIPVLDGNGYVNPQAWKYAIQDAVSNGITRADFIKQYGYLLYTENGAVSDQYGLTSQEKKLINGSDI